LATIDAVIEHEADRSCRSDAHGKAFDLIIEMNFLIFGRRLESFDELLGERDSRSLLQEKLLCVIAMS